jgi:hypothetical protein
MEMDTEILAKEIIKQKKIDGSIIYQTQIKVSSKLIWRLVAIEPEHMPIQKIVSVKPLIISRSTGVTSNLLLCFPINSPHYTLRKFFSYVLFLPSNGKVNNFIQTVT